VIVNATTVAPPITFGILLADNTRVQAFRRVWSCVEALECFIGSASYIAGTDWAKSVLA
jgi:hypothetical protein